MTLSANPPVSQPDPASPIVVPVGLGQRSYDIVIGRGVLGELGSRIAALRPGARVAILTDEQVARPWLAPAEAALARAGIAAFPIVVGVGEASKSYRVFEQVCEALIAGRIERNDLVVALGGGVIGDLAGFAASVLRRGVDFVQVPTSLLAQVDSSVGGKTGINSPLGKNLIGAFHQPILVVADAAVLDTLPPRHLRAGYAEIVKYGALGDAAFFDWLDTHRDEVLAGGAAREQAIATSCRAKAAIVARDEREQGERALLNLGHTFGHGLEAATGFSDTLFHGEGVALGMALAAAFSAEQGLMAEAEAGRLSRHLDRAGLPTNLAAFARTTNRRLDADHLMDLMMQDKKVRRGRLTFILLRGIGRAFVADDVAPDRVRDFLARKLSESS